MGLVEPCTCSSSLGKSALHWAAAVNNVEATLVLLKNGANRDMQDNKVSSSAFMNTVADCGVWLVVLMRITVMLQGLAPLDSAVLNICSFSAGERKMRKQLYILSPENFKF